MKRISMEFCEVWRIKKKNTEGVKETKGPNESACYFCNEMFEMGYLQNHLKQCGSILEQCPLRCGAWIQRKHKDTHVQECPRMEKNRNSGSPTHARISDPAPPPPPTAAAPAHTWAPRPVPLDDCVTYLEKEVAGIKLVVTEESSHRELQGSELESVRARLVLAEERGQRVLAALSAQRAAGDDEAARAAAWASQFKHDLAAVQIALQELQSQQLATAMRLESAVSSLLHEQRERELLEQALTQHDSRIRAVHKLEDVIAYIKQTVEEERARNEESRAALEAELSDARRCSAQLSQLAAARSQLHDAAADGPAMSRLAVLEVTTAEARAEAEAQARRADAAARDLRALSKSYLKLRGELADFQARVSFSSPEVGAEDGHLIWRIDNFTARMNDAKENDTVMCSPLFRTSKYGYTLKAEVSLNGIGKWKGRHMTGTVRLVGGAHDALLAWPCDLAVNVVLRDQPATRSQAMDIVKSLQLRRKSSSKRHDYDAGAGAGAAPERERRGSADALDHSVLQLKRQHVFFPHASLDKFDYVRDDVMFLEIIANE